MAFLTKKEQSLIKLINSNDKLSAKERAKMVQQINYNARLRQDGYKMPVREFIQEMAFFNVGKIFKSINGGN